MTDLSSAPVDFGKAGQPGPPPLVGGPPPGCASVETRGLRAWFGDHLVLEGVDLLMPAGQETPLIGTSACGKPTFNRQPDRMH